MFIGHYGIAFALKAKQPKISLGLMFLAVQLVDIVWTVLVMLGIEKVVVQPGITAATPLNFIYYPFTHSLLATLVWGGLVYAAVYFFKPSMKQFAGIFAVAVASHFALDLLTHRPDLPLAGNNSTMLGLGLWNYPLLAYGVEALIFIGGMALYFRRTNAKSFGGKQGWMIFAAVLVILNAINLFGPPPPQNTFIIAASGLANYLILTALAFWMDKKRIVNPES